MKEDLEKIVGGIEDADWSYYESEIRNIVRRRLEKKKLIDLPPFIVQELKGAFLF